MSLAHLKARCAGCEEVDLPMNKEHVFPEWLIRRTRTNKTGIRWGDKRRLPALGATFPLCKRCNSDFGRLLEDPMAHLFTALEDGRGLTDNEAELLVRWLWKIKGLDWIASHPDGDYSCKYTLRDRVLLPIDAIRGHLTVSIALLNHIRPDFGDLPMGVNAVTEHDAIFVAGVFSRIAVMVLLSDFEHLVPPQFGRYRLASEAHHLTSAKVLVPPVSFADDVEAVGVTHMAAQQLSRRHDELALAVLEAEEEADNLH